VAERTRICAGTSDGIYCTEKARADWRPSFLQGKRIVDLARMRTSWAAIAEEYVADTSCQGLSLPPIRKACFSWNDGVDWIPKDTLPLASGDCPPPESFPQCTPSSQAILCVGNGAVFRKSAADSNSGRAHIASLPFGQTLFLRAGRIYATDSLGALSVYGPSGWERALPPYAMDAPPSGIRRRAARPMR
jgi:hypothetical protein